MKVGPSESMSKSKNTIDPEKMIQIYGADAARLFILSDSPPEKIYNGRKVECHLFQIYPKILLSDEIINLINQSNRIKKEIDIFINQSIDKINFALDKFRYNVIIAVFHEIYSFFKNFRMKKKIIKIYK